MNMASVVKSKTLSGQPITLGDCTIVPRSRVLEVRLLKGLYVWNRPTAITVERHGKRADHFIVDMTRLVQLAVMSLSLSVVVWRVISSTLERSKTHD